MAKKPLTVHELLLKRTGVGGSFASLSLFLAGASIGGATMLAIASLVAYLGANALARERLAGHVVLSNQNLPLDNLVQQLPNQDYVIRANYEIKTGQRSMIIYCRDQVRFGQLIASGDGKRVEEILRIAKKDSIVYTAGPR